VSVRDVGPRAGALKIPRSFWVFWTARTLSWAGTGISGVVLPVLVYDRTGSPVLTTLLAVAEAVPYLALGLLAGAVADRFRRRGLMVGCDIGCAALMGSIPVAWALGGLTTGLVLLAALGAATAFVFFDAASFGAVPALAGRERVVGAVSGLSAASSVTTMIAPAVAGGLLAVLAPAQAVIVDAASYLASAVLLASIRCPFELPGTAGRPRLAWADMLEGARFIWRQPLLRAMTLLAATPVSVTGGAGIGLIVIYAVRALGLARTDPRIGLLYSAGAAGSTVAALALPRVRRRLRAGRVMLAFLALDAASLAWVALAPGFAVALPALACWEFCYSMVTINGIAERQVLTPDRLQSRVNTTARMLGWGGYPFGALIGGGLADVLPVRVTLLVMCAPVAAAAAAGLRSPPRREPARAQTAQAEPSAPG
jgi:Transmembrane secretion effector